MANKAISGMVVACESTGETVTIRVRLDGWSDEIDFEVLPEHVKRYPIGRRVEFMARPERKPRKAKAPDAVIDDVAS